MRLIVGQPTSAPPAQAAPVTGLALASATTNSLTLTFTPPASGTVSWAYRASGATAWLPLPSGSTIGSSSITIVGLASGMAYDVRGTTTLGSSTATADLGGISTTTTPVTPPTPTGAANKFEVVLDQSSVPVGGTATGNLYPNGIWGGGTATLTPSVGSAFSVSLPSSGSAAVPFSFVVSSAGEESFTPTNSAGLYNPRVTKVNAFNSSSGVARTLSASVAGSVPDNRTWDRDCASGTPRGFPAGFNKGWTPVGINITAISGGTDGLFVRLYDAQSAGATTTLGTGTALTGVVQVYGAVGTTGTFYPQLPASGYIYYVDLATDAAFTNPVRLAQRVRVGVVMAHFGRSYETGLGRAYAQASATTTFYTKTTTWMAFDSRYSTTDCGWFQHDGVTTDPYSGHYSESTSTGAQEMGRLLESRLGVCVSICGLFTSGGSFDVYVAHDGTIVPSFTDTVSAACGGKFRYLHVACSDWGDANDGYAESWAEVTHRITAAMDNVARTYPACAVIGWNHHSSGVFGADGSKPLGYTRETMFVASQVEPVNPMAVGMDNYLWNNFFSGHASQGARVDYVRPEFLRFMAAELAIMGGQQTSQRGPLLAASGTSSQSARTITIPYTLASGATLVAVGATYPDTNSSTYNTATSAEIAALFSVYVHGGYAGNGQAIKIDSAVISGGNVVLAVTGTSGITLADGSTAAWPSDGFAVHYAADFGASNPAITSGSNRGAMLADNRLMDGIPYGWCMRPALDIVVPAGA